jgi:hypothetical protein
MRSGASGGALVRGCGSERDGEKKRKQNKGKGHAQTP